MRALAMILSLSLVGCGGGGSAASIVPIASTTTTVATTTPDNAVAYTCPNATTSSGALDCTRLPLGDRKFSTTGAKAGYIYSCQNLSGSPVVSSAPWLNSSSNTWSLVSKIAVQGAVAWGGAFASSVNGATNTLISQEVPTSPHTTGTFPIASTDPAYRYDRNPNSIARHAKTLVLKSNPAVNANPTCLGMGTIGMTTTGVAIYNGFDAAGYDAVAREVQDSCHGHPDQSSTYHYHGVIQACVPDSGAQTQNSSLLGYALDGFGIYGPWYGGKILTTRDLDACHGITSPVMWNGKLVSIYHYVSTYDFPYTLGCYRGTPVQP